MMPFEPELNQDWEGNWEAAPPDIQVPARGRLEVWLVPLPSTEAVYQDCWRLLSPAEQARAARFYFEKDRQHFVKARAALRHILSAYLGTKPQDLEFSYGPQGKPALADQEFNSKLTFNLSHSAELALLAVSGLSQAEIGAETGIGVDLERLRPVEELEQIAGNFFSRREKQTLQSLAPEARSEAFFRAWTRKEAYLKAIGTGLSRALHDIEVSLAPGEPARFLTDSPELQSWSLLGFQPAPGYLAALAYPQQVRSAAKTEFRFYDWEAPLSSKG